MNKEIERIAEVVDVWDIDQDCGLQEQRLKNEIADLLYSVRAETEAAVTKRERAESELLAIAMKLHVIVRGDFDDGAYGRYDEPVFCWFVAEFRGGPFEKTPRAKGDTPQEAVRNLFASVRDKQRLQKMLAAYESNDAGESR